MSEWRVVLDQYKRVYERASIWEDNHEIANGLDPEYAAQIAAEHNTRAALEAQVAHYRAALETELDVAEDEMRSMCRDMHPDKIEEYVRDSIRGRRIREALATAGPGGGGEGEQAQRYSPCCHCDGTGREKDGETCLICHGTACSFHRQAVEPSCGSCRIA